MDFLTSIAKAFSDGGIWMYLIAAFQVASIAIVIERTLALFKDRDVNQLEVVKTFEDNIRRGEIDTVVAKAQANKAINPVARAIEAGAKAAQNFGGKEEIQGKMDEVLLLENSQLDKRVGFLSMLGNVATLTGLLGTITGMIKSFAAVSQANPADKAALLSSGISEAMNATAYGLIVAIPALVAYAILQNRSNALADDLNQAALKAYNWLSYAYDPVSVRATASAKKTSSKDREVNA
ncbi:MAG TPA: MotA/TolQ/ExbB proton channel family protein [Bdellovibrionales bacterium]|nr:MotA/TolQ/ExbB proton channel family protein [Bdellovibrionales bacterium]